ncbi:hypothetical protein [Tenacibaculum sp. 190524A05c]|uniref:RipA family octameric membrane protein n=1 Tax=Tenacibaculum platacis TaxID=3137852 RepID=UPI0031FB60B8
MEYQIKVKKIMSLKINIKSFWKFAFTKDENAMVKISENEYIDIFIRGKTPEQIKATYDKAWETKNFEIELYWKRTNYFWVFQIASFTGYFTIIGTDAYTLNPQILYLIVCIGFITGPLYKFVTSPKTDSVSKINEIVSRFGERKFQFYKRKFIVDQENHTY